MKTNRKNFLITILFISVLNVVNSQNNNFSEKDSIHSKKNLHSIEIEPYSVGYSYAHKISKSGYIGAQINAGLGVHFFLNTPQYLEYKSGECDSTGCYYNNKKKFLSPTLELLKIRLFYKIFVTKNVNVEAGTYLSLGDLPTVHEQTFISPTNYNIGGSLSIFYGCKTIKFGQRLQLGNIHIKYTDGIGTNLLSLVLTPIVVRFSW